MAGLGAMAIGLIGGGIMMFCIAVEAIIFAAIVYFDARRHNLKAVLWAVIALVFNLYSLPFYIYVRIKTANLKCESRGTKVGQKSNFCPVCGTEIKKFDDAAFAKKVIKYVIIAVAAFGILGAAYVAVIGMINP